MGARASGRMGAGLACIANARGDRDNPRLT
jgi:hypothetical protein